MPARPNILLLLSDQHPSSIAGFAGDKVVRTQNLDALIRSLGSAPPKPAAFKTPSAGFSPNTAAEMGALSAELKVIGGLLDREPPAATMPSRRVESVEMELMELQGALEAERAVNKRLSTQLHTTVHQQANAAARRLHEEEASRAAAESLLAAERSAADAEAARGDAMHRLATCQLALAEAAKECEAIIAGLRAGRSAAVAAL